MAGCSIVVLTIVFLPVMIVVSLACLVAMATIEFVTSPAFPCLVISVVCSVLAIVDLARILWRRYREGESFVLERSLFVRPGILCAVAFAFFVVTVVLSASMIYAWYTSLGA